MLNQSAKTRKVLFSSNTEVVDKFVRKQQQGCLVLDVCLSSLVTFSYSTITVDITFRVGLLKRNEGNASTKIREPTQILSVPRFLGDQERVALTRNSLFKWMTRFSRSSRQRCSLLGDLHRSLASCSVQGTTEKTAVVKERSANELQRAQSTKNSSFWLSHSWESGGRCFCPGLALRLEGHDFLGAAEKALR